MAGYRAASLADPPHDLSVSTFEVLVGAAPGFQLHIVQWSPEAPPPHGAVIAGVSARGDPLLAAVAEQYTAGKRSVYAGYASTRDGLVVVASEISGVLQLPWCVGGGFRFQYALRMS